MSVIGSERPDQHGAIVANVFTHGYSSDYLPARDDLSKDTVQSELGSAKRNYSYNSKLQNELGRS